MSSAALARASRANLFAQRIALAGAILGVWWLASLGMPHYVLPGPARVYGAFERIVANGELARNLAVTLQRVCIGFALATMIGVPLGILFGALRRFGEFFEPVLPVLNTVSSAI